MLIDSLRALFAFTSVISQQEALLIAIATFAFIYWITPQPQLTHPEFKGNTFYWYLQTSWLGRMSLTWAFWPFFVLFNSMLFYIDYRAINGTFTLASWVTMHIISVMPVIYWTGAVWRCSEHCDSKIWVVCARFFTVAAYFDYVLRLVLYLDYPDLIVSCGQVMIEAGGCWE